MKRSAPAQQSHGCHKFANHGRGRVEKSVAETPSDAIFQTSGIRAAGGSIPTHAENAILLDSASPSCVAVCRGGDGADAGSGLRRGGYQIEKWEDEDVANALIVKEMTELSLQDRSKILDDVHGVSAVVEETDEFLSPRLHSMMTAIKWTKKKHAYELARFLSPSFVADRNLHLTILRSVDYDAATAARKMVGYFDFKLQLFGHDNLVRPITQSVLSSEMLDLLRTCYVQVLPSKDRVGRPILFVYARDYPAVSWKVQHGVMWYLCSKAAEEKESQRKGFVLIVYGIGMVKHTGQSFSETMMKSKESIQSLPIKVASNHFIFNNPSLKAVISVLQMAHPRRFRLRTCAHFGSHLECVYKLLSYGIVPNMIPVDMTGKFDTESGNRILARYLQDEDRAAGCRQNIIPNSKDVILGRGYHFVNFVGNVYLADLIHRNRTRHASLKRLEKSSMSRAIAQYIRDVHGGRFLKRVVAGKENVDGLISNMSPDDEFTWVLATDDDAWTKVSHGFRRAPNKEYHAQSTEYTIESGDNEKCTILVPHDDKHA